MKKFDFQNMGEKMSADNNIINIKTGEFTVPFYLSEFQPTVLHFFSKTIIMSFIG